MTVKLKINRGLPGSGKSTHGVLMRGFTLIEADMYHVHHGVYKFMPDRIDEAREWVNDTVVRLLQSGQNVVVAGVFCTNQSIWELKDHVDRNVHGTVLHRVQTLTTAFGNIHDVPTAILGAMADAFEVYDVNYVPDPNQPAPAFPDLNG